MNKIKEKPIWYENPVNYIAAILLLLGFRLIVEALHKLLPTIVTINGSMLDGPLFVILIVSLFLLIKKGRRNKWIPF